MKSLDTAMKVPKVFTPTLNMIKETIINEDSPKLPPPLQKNVDPS